MNLFSQSGVIGTCLPAIGTTTGTPPAVAPAGIVRAVGRAVVGDRVVELEVLAEVQGGGDVHAVGGHAADIDQDRRRRVEQVERRDIEQPVVEVHMVIVGLALDAGQGSQVEIAMGAHAQLHRSRNVRDARSVLKVSKADWVPRLNGDEAVEVAARGIGNGLAVVFLDVDEDLLVFGRRPRSRLPAAGTSHWC